MEKVVSNAGVVGEKEFWNEIFETGHSVYEVIRIINGTALFCEDHFERLLVSSQLGNFNFRMEFSEFQTHISELISQNQKLNGNVKFLFSETEHQNYWVFSFIPHNYPTSEAYLHGVNTDLLFIERENPNAKLIQNSVRFEADQMIAERNLYEILLVDRHHKITEGSRSNVFFVKDEVFYTAHDTQVLPGITRQKIIVCLKKLGFEVIEVAVAASEISQFEAAFLTGTSPKVLPIRSIGNQKFKTQLPSVQKLMNMYDQMIEEYLKRT
ncbi:MAG TPA: aminotransferase class IV [Prolixibacteraceae bacterium]|nr:aminotransferase class IV [Prolixibacteraceae bacterium]